MYLILSTSQYRSHVFARHDNKNRIMKTIEMESPACLSFDLLINCLSGRKMRRKKKKKKPKIKKAT